MQFSFLKDTKIDFLGKRYLFFAISGALILGSIVSLIVRGPNYGIDFSGGLLMQVTFAQPVSLDDVRSGLDNIGLGKVELQSSHNSVIIRAKQSGVNEDAFSAKTSAALREKFQQNSMTVDRVEFVGPAVGRHLGKQAFYAMIFSFIGIIIYVAFRFHSSIWGFAGVVGIVHDCLVVFGIFVMLGREINLTVIAALLTIAGFSINDTIVVFDRIRENLRLLSKEDFGSIINRSINDTLSRTIITNSTVFAVVLSLYFLGGEVINDFAFAMVMGSIVGTYSSIYVCSPIVYEWEERKKKRVQSFGKTAKAK